LSISEIKLDAKGGQEKKKKKEEKKEEFEEWIFASQEMLHVLEYTAEILRRKDRQRERADI